MAYLVHARRLNYESQALLAASEEANKYYYDGKCDAFKTQQGIYRVSMSFMNKKGYGFFIIVDVKPNDPNETATSIRLKAEQFLRLYHRDEYKNGLIPSDQVGKACVDAFKNLKRNQQHQGYYSPNLLGHSDDSVESIDSSKFDVIDVSEEYLAHRRTNIDYTGYQHEGYYSPNNRTYNMLFNGAQISDNGPRSNPKVWIQFMSPTNGNDVRDTRDGDPVSTTSFIADPRMIKNDSLTRQMVEGAIKQLHKEFGNHGAAYKLNDVEITKCVATVRRLLTKYQQSHPNFVDHLNVSHSYTVVYQGDELYHHGILGMKWGVRRYQNEDGSLTEAGRKRYGVEGAKEKIENTKGIRNKQKVAKQEIAKSAAGTAVGATAAVAAANAANKSLKMVHTVNMLKSIVSYGTAGGLGGRVVTAHEAAYVLSRMGAMATIIPALATPVGQIAMAGVTLAGAGMTAYGVYKGIKMAQVNHELNQEVEQIIRDAEKEKK